MNNVITLVHDLPIQSTSTISATDLVGFIYDKNGDCYKLSDIIDQNVNAFFIVYFNTNSGMHQIITNSEKYALLHQYGDLYFINNYVSNVIIPPNKKRVHAKIAAHIKRTLSQAQTTST